MRRIAIFALMFGLCQLAQAAEKQSHAVPSRPKVLPDCPCAKAAADTACVSIQPALETRVYPLQHIPPKQAALQVDKLLRGRHRVKHAVHGVVVDSDVIIVPDRAANSLIVHCSGNYGECLGKLIEQIDQPPNRYVVEFRLAQHEGGKSKVIAAPTLITSEARPATIAVGSGKQHVQVTVTVKSDPAGLHPHAASQASCDEKQCKLTCNELTLNLCGATNSSDSCCQSKDTAGTNVKYAKASCSAAGSCCAGIEHETADCSAAKNQCCEHGSKRDCGVETAACEVRAAGRAYCRSADVAGEAAAATACSATAKMCSCGADCQCKSNATTAKACSCCSGCKCSSCAAGARACACSGECQCAHCAAKTTANGGHLDCSAVRQASAVRSGQAAACPGASGKDVKQTADDSCSVSKCAGQSGCSRPVKLESQRKREPADAAECPYCRRKATNDEARNDRDVVEKSIRLGSILHIQDAATKKKDSRSPDSICDFNIVIDGSGRKKRGKSCSAALDIDIDRVLLNSALETILAPLALSCRTDRNSIQTAGHTRPKRRLTVVYPVADLLCPRDRCHDGDKTGLEMIAEIITETIEPASWEEAGGSGSIRGNESTQSLVVRQPADTHEQITALLGGLRKVVLLHGSHGAEPSEEQDVLFAPAQEAPAALRVEEIRIVR